MTQANDIHGAGECPHCGADIAPGDIDKPCWDCGEPAMTHTAKHTPGPWVVRNRDAVYAQSGRFIADCELTPYGSRPQPPNNIDEANAALIAAAPAMYEALRAIIKNWERGDLAAAVRQGAAALAQADGKQKVS